MSVTSGSHQDSEHSEVSNDFMSRASGHTSSKRAHSNHLEATASPRKRLRPSPDVVGQSRQHQNAKPDARHVKHRNSTKNSLEEWLATCSPKPAKAVGIHISLKSSFGWVDYVPDSLDSTPKENSPFEEVLAETTSKKTSIHTIGSSLSSNQSNRPPSSHRPKGSAQRSPSVGSTKVVDGNSLRGASPELGSVRTFEKRRQSGLSNNILQPRDNEGIARRLNGPKIIKLDITLEEGAEFNTNLRASAPFAVSTTSSSSISLPPRTSAVNNTSTLNQTSNKTHSKPAGQQPKNIPRHRPATPGPSTIKTHSRPRTQTPSSDKKQPNINMFLVKSPPKEAIMAPRAVMSPLHPVLNTHGFAENQPSKGKSPELPIVSPTLRTARKRLPTARSSATPTSPSLSGSGTESVQESYTIPRGPRELRPRADTETQARKNNREWQQKFQNHPFMHQLRSFQYHQRIDIVNEVDDTPPPTNFRFVKRSEFRGKASRPDPEANYGCSCESNCDANSCSCIAEQLDPEDRAENRGQMPYTNGKFLTREYQRSRVVIHECNSKCSCPPTCRNRNVGLIQGINLEIFKTVNRGWGVRSRDAVRRGQLVDTYRGEILTDEEANARSEERLGKDVYLFNLDRFASDLPEGEKPYVIDAEFAGSAARFINHSCDPNVGVYGVSLFRGNPRVYELAFFALRDILPGEEMVFDYQGMDKDDERWEEGQIPDSQEEGLECQCGAPQCRGRFW